MEQNGFMGINRIWAKFDGKVCQTEKKKTLSPEMFLEIRNLMLMSIIPKKLNAAENEQTAYLRAAIVRVNIFNYLKKNLKNFIKILYLADP